MRFKRCTLLLFLALIAPAFNHEAFANSVTLTYEYQTHSNYYFSVNGSSSMTPLMCDAFDNTIYRGETWGSSVSPFLQGISGSMFGPSMTLDYKAAGLIYQSMLAGTLTTLQAQWAVWGLFSFNAKIDPLFWFYGGAGTDAKYLALASTAPDSAYSGLLLYTPYCARPGYGPQEFIGYAAMPEPSCITLFGTGLLALAGALHHKFSKSS